MKKKILLFVAILAAATAARSQEKTAKDWYLSLLPKIKAEVKPMLSTRWGQNAPYHNDCPTAPGKSVHCKTGCVATAMAQVMRYYRYPDQGKGTVNYSYQDDAGQLQAIEADLGKSSYSWDLMRDSYLPTDSRTAAEQEAVARLMADCGAAVQMDYGQYDSGAFDMDVPQAMVNHFGYDPAIVHMSAYEEFSDSLWFCTLYEQLSAGMPVLYGGVTESYGAHSFVVDGYNAEGKFHVVYGLGGGDSFYDLKQIPYRYGRSMTINIRPPKPTGIGAKMADNSRRSAAAEYFLMDGTRTKAPRKGINIVRTQGGKTRKIAVR